MKCSKYTKQFFRSECFMEEFPGYNSCLTGSAVASILGISPWESRQELFKRLTAGRVKGEITWEMRRGMQYKETVFHTFSKSSPSEVFRRNPFTARKDPNGPRQNILDKNRKFYACSNICPGIGGLVDAFLVNRNTGHVAAGMMVRTSGLSSVEHWADYPPKIHVAQSLFYSGLCERLPWVISVMLFRPDPNSNNEERIPFEIRNFWMKFDQALFEHINERVMDFWNNNFMKGVEPDDVDATETDMLLDNYIQRKTAILRITPPFAKKK